MGRNRKSRRSPAPGADEPRGGWQSSPRRPNETTKRRLDFYSPGDLSTRIPEPQDAELIAVLGDMGEAFALGDQERRSLLDTLKNLVLSVTQALQVWKQQPPKSEVIERLEQIERKSEELFQLLDPVKSTSKAWEEGITSREYHRYIGDLLRSAAQSEAARAGRNGAIVSTALAAVAALATFARLARGAVEISAPARRDPSKIHAAMMGALYREAFGKAPSRTENGPWVKFLAWGRELAGLPPLSAGRLRQLPTSGAELRKHD
jgi:hypothetical protein